MSLSGFFRFGTNKPVWVGTAIDKLVIGVVPAAYAIATIPLIVWAFITFIVAEIVSITANMYNWVIVTLVMTILFSVFVLYEPLFAMTLQIAAPILQLVIFFLIILLNVLLVLLRLLIDTWNAFVPVIILTIVYLVDFICEFLRILASLLTDMDLTAMVYDLLEICWVFVDITIDLLNILFALAPTVLVFTAQIVGVIFLIIFESIFFFVPYLEWLIEVLPPLLIPVLDAVIELVEVFASLLAGGAMGAHAFSARSLLSVNGFTSSSQSSTSSRFDDGIVRYFQAMHTSARNQPVGTWAHETRNLADATKKRVHIVVPEVHHVTGNTLVGSQQYKLDAMREQQLHTKRSEFADFEDDDDDEPETSNTMFSRPRLVSRFRRPGMAFYHPEVHIRGPVPDLVLRDATTGRFHFNPKAGIIGALSDHVTMTNDVFGLGSKKRSFTMTAAHTAFANNMNKRARRGSSIASAASFAAHSTLDVMPGVEDHVYAVQSSFTGLARRYGFESVTHAVSHYRANYPTTWHFVATEMPDVSKLPFVDILVRAEHEASPPGMKRHFWHEWMASPRPVRGFRDDRAINSALESERALRKSPGNDGNGIDAVGSIDSTASSIGAATLPITSVADCYTTDPRNILCIPQIPYSWQIPFFYLDLPTELDRDCPGFIAPPNILEDGSISVFHWFDPWVITWNTITWIRTLIGWFTSILFLFDAIAVRFYPLRFLTKIFLYSDPRDGGVEIETFLCLILLSWYPIAFVYFWYTVGILWPPLSRFFSQVYTSLSAATRASNRATSKMSEYLQEPDPAAFPVRFYTRNKVADQYFLQNSPYEAHSRGARPYPIPHQVIRRGVFPDGQQFDVQSATAGIDSSDRPQQSLLLGSPEQEQQMRLEVANRQRMEHLSLIVGDDIDHVARLRACALIDDAPLHAMYALRTIFEERLVRARETERETALELQRLVDRLEASGLIDGSITQPQHATRHRVGVFARRSYIHGHWLTPAWLIHMAQSIGFQRKLKGYEEKYVAL